jgi:putative restriction endonuclease
MPAVPPDVIVNAILDAIQQSGGSAIYISGVNRIHPREFLVQYLERSFSIWVYIWTLTHGGRTSLPNEYRIQMTSVQSPLTLNPDGYTVLLGYYPDLDVFAGFDLRRHRTFTPGSSSVQISIEALHDALQYGLAFRIKTNQEVAVGIRPDQILAYTLNAEAFHEYGSEVQTFKLLQKASQTQKITKDEIESIAANRRKLVSAVETYSKDSNFRKKVLDAYGHRCAVTRAQLKLVDAAHILPVPAPQSSDDVTNGLALSPTMHRAYDNCLIYLDKDCFMRLNDEKANELSRIGLAAGLTQLKNLLNIIVHLPADKNQWPRVEFIERANKYRRIPGYY